MLEIKIPLEVANFSAVPGNHYSMQNCMRRCVYEYIFQRSTVFEKSRLIGYRGVLTVTGADFGPRTLLTTGATA